MTYSVGGKVEATDFNGFASSNTPNLNSIWSTGSGSSGYGQTAISTVTAGAKVLATSWSQLENTITAVANHQGTSITALTPPAVNDIVEYVAAISTNLTAINGGILNCSAVGTDITGSASRTAPWGTGQSIPTVTSTVTVTFASANAARYFFNAGGQILVSCSRSGGSGNPENLSWNTLCSDIGTIGLPAVNTSQSLAGTSYAGLTKFGGGGATPTVYTRNGYYQLGSTATLFTQYSNVGPYTNDYISISYASTGATVTIVVQFTDTSSFFANTIDGTLTVNAIARQPETTYLSNSWGTPSVSVTAPA